MFAGVYTTIDDMADARKIAHALVEEQICACVNIFQGVESVYKWMGKVETSQEISLLAKTTEENVKKTIERIKELHTYDVPSIAVFPIVGGSKEYLDYIDRETA